MTAVLHVLKEGDRTWCGLPRSANALPPRYASLATCQRCVKSLRSV